MDQYLLVYTQIMSKLTATPGIFISQLSLLRFKLSDLDHNNKDNWYNEIRRPMKKLTGYGFDNSILYWKNLYGDVFSISIHKCTNNKTGDYWSIGVWNFEGHTSICSFTKKVEDPDEKFPEEFYKEMVKRCEEHTKGVIHCSDCDTLMLDKSPKGEFAEYGGRYFAARYCNVCWTTKGHKEREAKETYE